MLPAMNCRCKMVLHPLFSTPEIRARGREFCADLEKLRRW
jgi:hypothetical protein